MAPVSITRRPATSDDTAFALATHHAALRHVIVATYGAWDEKIQDRYFLDSWRQGDFEIIASAATPCGYIRVIRHTPELVEIDQLIIHPDHQNRGIGGRILADEVAKARARGDTLLIKTQRVNRAQGLYARHGFAVSSQTATHVHMRLAQGQPR